MSNSEDELISKVVELINKGKLDEALKVLECKTNNPIFNVIKGDIFYFKGDFIKAFHFWREAFKAYQDLKDKDVMGVINRIFQVAETKVDKDILEEIKKFEECTKDERLLVLILIAEGIAGMKVDVKEGEKAFERALELSDEGIRAIVHLKRGDVYEGIDQEKALSDYLEAAKTGDVGVKAEALSKAGIICLKLGKVEEGKRYIEESLNANKSGANVFNIFMNAGFILKLADDELSEFEELRKLKDVIFWDFVDQAYELTDAGKFDEALRLLQVAEMCGKAERKGVVYFAKGYVMQEEGEWDKALEYYGRSLEIFERVGDKKGIGESLHQIGTVYQDKGEWDKALEYYERSLEIKEEIGDKGEIGGSLHNIGTVYQYKGEWDKALEYYERSLEIFERVGDKKGIGESLHQIGTVYQLKGEWDKALEYYERSLEIKEEIGDKRGISRSLHNIGAIYQDKGEWDKALEYYERSLEIFERVGDKRGISRSLHNIGAIYQLKGEWDKALEYYERSLEIFERVGDKKGIGESLHNIGAIYQDKGEWDKALEYYERSLEIKKEIGDKRGIGQSLHQIGVIYQDKGEWDKALEYYERSLEIKKEIGDKRGIGGSLHNIGMVYQLKGEWDKALEYYERSLEIFERVGDKRGIGGSLHQIGMVYQDKGELDRALECHERSLRIFKEIGDPEGIIKSAIMLYQCTKEEEYVELALSNFLDWRAKLHLLTAKELTEMYVDMFSNVVEDLLDVNIELALKVYSRLKNRSAAELFGCKFSLDEECWREVAELEEEVRRLEREKKRRERGEEKKEEREGREKSKGEVGVGVEVESELEAEKIAKTQTEVLRAYRQKIEECTRKALGRTSITEPGYEPEVIDLYFGRKIGYFYNKKFKEVEILLDWDISSIINYLEMGTRINRIKIGKKCYIEVNGKKREITAFEGLLYLSDIFSRIVNTFVELPRISKRVKDIERDVFKIERSLLEQLGECYSFLFEFEGVRLSPSYPMLNFPFHLLTDGKRYLYEKGVIYHVVSIEKPVPEKEKRYVIYDSRDNLKYTREEVKEVGEIIGAEVIDGSKTDVSSLTKPADVIHFSCHARAGVRAYESVISVGREYKMFELSKLKPVDLVVLSACESAVHELSKDTLSFPILFMAMGAKRVLASLWRVPDDITYEEMVEFYRGMDYESYVKALNKGRKVCESKGLKGVHHWGAFSCYGSW